MKKDGSLFLFALILGAVCLVASTNNVQRIGPLRDEGFNLRFIDTIKCIDLQQQALAIAKQQGDQEEQVISYTQLALTYRLLFNKKQFNAYTDSAYSLANMLKTPRSTAYADLAMGFLKSSVGDHVGTANYLLNAYVYFDEVKDHRTCEKIAIEIANNFDPGDVDKQEKYALIALNEAAQINEPEYTLLARGTFANYLVFQRNASQRVSIDSIIHYLQQTIELTNTHMDAIITKANLATVYLNLSAMYFDSLTPEREPLLWNNLNKSINLARLYKVPTVHARSIGLMGDYLLQKGQFTAAEQLFKDGIAYQKAQPFQDHKILTLFYDALKEVALKQEDFKKYYQYDSVYTIYSKLRLNDAVIQALQNADVRFETTSKINQIAALEKENALQRNNKWLGYGTAALLAIGLILMFGAYYFRQKYHLQSENVLREQQKTTALQLQLQKQETMEVLTQKLSLERRLLQSQMNPHFLFNALGNIQSFMLQHDSLNAVAYLATFSKLMRQTLVHSKKESIALEDEIDMLKNYIEMQKLRLNHSFDYSIGTDQSLDIQTEIPPMLIQPFIENAIEHGLKPLDVGIRGKLHIYFKENKQQQSLVCMITDNGIGLRRSREMKQKDTGHQSLAIAITRERLQYLTGQCSTAAVTISELKDHSGLVLGTKVSINIPVNF